MEKASVLVAFTGGLGGVWEDRAPWRTWFEGERILEEAWSYGDRCLVTGDTRWPSHHTAWPFSPCFPYRSHGCSYRMTHDTTWLDMLAWHVTVSATPPTIYPKSRLSCPLTSFIGSLFLVWSNLNCIYMWTAETIYVLLHDNYSSAIHMAPSSAPYMYMFLRSAELSQIV